MLLKNINLFLFFIPFFVVAQVKVSDTLVEPNFNIEKGKDLISAPVILNGDTLFFINSSTNAYPAVIRAKVISERLQLVQNNFNPLVDSIFLVNQSTYLETRINDKLLFITTIDDVVDNQTTLLKLANYRMKIFQESLMDEPELSFYEQLKNIGFFILALLVLIAYIKLINFLFKKLNERLSKIERKFLKKNRYILKYFIPKKTANIFVLLSNIIRISVILISFIVYSPFMFSFFPWAKDVVELFYSYISRPIKYIFFGFIDFIPSLFFIIIIALFARYIVRVGKEIAMDVDSGKLEFKSFHRDWAMPTEKIFSVLIYAMALILIFPYIPGSGSSAFQGVSIFIGALISFGSTSAIANIIAGIVITYMRPFQIGDRVKINDVVGDVTDKTILVTHILTVKNEGVTIPNANILLGTITNYSHEKEKSIILHTTITLGYDVAWKTAEKLLLAAANNTQFVDKKPPPFVLQKSLDDYYVSYELNVHTQYPKKMPFIYSEMHKNILDIFNEAEVEILSPAYMSARDGSLSTIPGKVKPDQKSPISKLVDHLTGRNQKINVTKKGENEE